MAASASRSEHDSAATVFGSGRALALDLEMHPPPPPFARWPGTLGSWLAGYCLWVLVWTGACYWNGAGGFMFNSPSSALVLEMASWKAESCVRVHKLCGARQAGLLHQKNATDLVPWQHSHTHNQARD